MNGEVGSTVCPSGGTPNQWLALQAKPTIPTRCYRIIAGLTWAQDVWPRWMLYVGRRSVAEEAIPPRLGAPGTPGLYVTDRRSLAGLVDPADFARRLGLASDVQLEVQMHGCAVVGFRPPPDAMIVTPSPAPGALAGLTAAGGREWLLRGNLSLAPGMVVTILYSTAVGHRWTRMSL